MSDTDNPGMTFAEIDAAVAALGGTFDAENEVMMHGREMLAWDVVFAKIPATDDELDQVEKRGRIADN
jgi:hypothetical protein